VPRRHLGSTSPPGTPADGALLMAHHRERVVVLGGGVGAITTAFALTDPRHGDRYDVTLYQLGWRLGGKGASGRGPNMRIEEHGLHLWFGFYENAFREMRSCYEELGRGPEVPLRTVDEAFRPASRFGVAEHRLDRWSNWIDWFPETDGVPGTERPGHRHVPTVGHYVVQLIRLAESAVRGTVLSRSKRCSRRRPRSSQHHCCHGRGSRGGATAASRRLVGDCRGPPACRPDVRGG
jgi:uncharacterized protein with NAD-binding domain and iron-sulfur cluster